MPERLKELLRTLTSVEMDELWDWLEEQKDAASQIQRFLEDSDELMNWLIPKLNSIESE